MKKAFDIKKLAAFAEKEILEFITQNQDESFYAFAIDNRQLCFNSDEQFEETLEAYKKSHDESCSPLNSLDELKGVDKSTADLTIKWMGKLGLFDPNNDEECLNYLNSLRKKEREKGNIYNNPEEIEELRYNTGDWEYFGFSQFNTEVGFDEDLYDDFYNMPDEEQPNSQYYKSMKEVIKILENSDVFKVLKKSQSGFKAFLAMPSY